MAHSFRHSAGFGKRMEYWIAGQMLKEGLDVYMPLVDDLGIDAVVRKPSGEFVEIQIKASSKNVAFGTTGLFAAIRHEKRDNYYFLFYSERLGCFWLFSSEEFIKESAQNKTGKNKGNRSIHLNGTNTKLQTEYCKSKFNKYIIKDFNRLKK